MLHNLGMNCSPGGRGYQWANRVAWCAGLFAAFISISLLSPWYIGLPVAIAAIWITTALSGLLWYHVGEILTCHERFHRTKSGIILTVAIPVGLLAFALIPNWHDFEIDSHPSLLAVAGSVFMGLVSFIYGAGIMALIGTATLWFTTGRRKLDMELTQTKLTRTLWLPARWVQNYFEPQQMQNGKLMTLIATYLPWKYYLVVTIQLDTSSLLTKLTKSLIQCISYKEIHNEITWYITRIFKCNKVGFVKSFDNPIFEQEYPELSKAIRGHTEAVRKFSKGAPIYSPSGVRVD